MTDERQRRIAEIKEREAKAIEGPWYPDGLDRFSADEPWVFDVVTRNSDRSLNSIVCHVPSDVESNNTQDHPAAIIDAHRFIAHARADIPWLLEQLEIAQRYGRTEYGIEQELRRDLEEALAELARLKGERRGD